MKSYLIPCIKYFLVYEIPIMKRERNIRI